jgi:hypothetical protein
MMANLHDVDARHKAGHDELIGLIGHAFPAIDP